MSTVISIVNQKGGVCKTTSTFHFAHALAEGGKKRVLLVDFDPQATLTETCGYNPHQVPATVYDLIVDTGVEIAPQAVVQKTSMDGVFLLPSNIELAEAEQRLIAQMSREQVFNEVMDQLRGDYDLVLIDCPPSLGILTTNALTASDLVLVPMATEHIALRALQHLFPMIEKVQSRLNPKLSLLGIAVTRHKSRAKLAQNVLEQLREAFGDLVFDTVIHNSVRPEEAMAVNRTLFAFDPTHPTTKAYQSLVAEIAERLKPQSETPKVAAAAGNQSHG